MGINSIAGGAGALQLNPFNINSSLLQTKDTSAANAPSSAQNDQRAISSTNSEDSSATKKPSPITGNAGNKKPVRSMSHVVESYNAQGKLRIKYEDSNSNVIYQIPPEMVAKTQDLMTNTQAAADVKG